MNERMSGELVSRIERGAHDVRLVLSGALTESCDLTSLVGASVEEVVIDLGDLQVLNSGGLREWLKFVKAWNKSGARLVLERCSPIVVSQLNLFRDFAGKGGLVRSVLAPYICNRCEKIQELLIELHGLPVALEEVLPCSCGGQLEFEDLTDEYLSFLR
jgi:hypothetical protein